jgi:hypothetical protein
LILSLQPKWADVTIWPIGLSSPPRMPWVMPSLSMA